MSNWWKAVSIWSMLGPPSLFKQRRGKAPERNAALEVCVRWRFGRWKLKSCPNSARCSELSARRKKKRCQRLNTERDTERAVPAARRDAGAALTQPFPAAPGGGGARGKARHGAAERDGTSLRRRWGGNGRAPWGAARRQRPHAAKSRNSVFWKSTRTLLWKCGACGPALFVYSVGRTARRSVRILRWSSFPKQRAPCSLLTKKSSYETVPNFGGN